MSALENRAILHVDMDAFFVSVELRERPELRHEPVIVGFPNGRSVVLSASYDCRARGVRSAMPMSQAIALMPQATIIEPQHGVYSAVSAQIMNYFETITPLVEQVSIDEAFLDVTGSMRLLGGPIAIAHQIRAHLAEELNLPSSIGIARNKFVAKLASTHAKPNGLIVVAPERTTEFLHQLPVSAMWGVGKKTGEQLHALAIETIEQLANEPQTRMIQRFGEHGRSLHLLAHGIDNRAVQTTREEKSISAEHTFAGDIADLESLEEELLRLGHRIGQRLRASNKAASAVGLKLKYQDFTGVTRSRTFAAPTDSSSAISQNAIELLRRMTPLPQSVRLVGVKVERLSDPDLGIQLSLDPAEGKTREAERVADEISHRFPDSGLAPARFLRPKEK
ncbi:DNA polymerase IV [Glutamicibacter sp. 287]|uniref:DNA polymerase IV n=1 Tax=unclassified Glutamicibacter TaxID=2627139 RepID=UPI0015968480|nr:DNA polymerase IV [Glutamicibacter sp. BW80]